MPEPTIEHEIRLTVYGTVDPDTLVEFADTARALNLLRITWTATPGDQRDPATLTLKARP